MVRGIASQILVRLHGRRETFALIHVEGNQAFLSFADLVGLLLKREQEIFLQAHIEKRADL